MALPGRSVQLEAAILNLVVNARDAMPEGGKLRIEMANVAVGIAGGEAERGVVAGDYVRIVVSDTGHGMPPEVIDRVFEPFFTTKEVGKGSGLGLSQVYGFVKQSDGHILINSTPGEGTAFTLYLPRSDVSIELSSARDDARAHEAPGGSETVLIVDDNADVREVTTVIVGSLGYEVLSAMDATEALALIRDHRDIDLLISDIVMSGGIDGFELARRARSSRPSLAILLMSGYAAGSTARRASSRSCTSRTVARSWRGISGPRLAARLCLPRLRWADAAHRTSGIETPADCSCRCWRLAMALMAAETLGVDYSQIARSSPTPPRSASPGWPVARAGRFGRKKFVPTDDFLPPRARGGKNW